MRSPAPGTMTAPPCSSNSGGRWQTLARRAWDDEFHFVGENHGLYTIAKVELLQDVGDVRLRRVLAHHEFRRDLLVGQPAGDEPEDLELTRRQLLEFGRRLP